MDTENSNREVAVYLLYSPITGEPKYVGASLKGAEARRDEHIREAFGGYPTNFDTARWIWSLADQGYTPSFYVLEVCAEENRVERERYWIAHYAKQGACLTNRRPSDLIGPRPSRSSELTDEFRLTLSFRAVWHAARQMGLDLEDSVLREIGAKWRNVRSPHTRISSFITANLPAQGLGA